MCNPSDPRVCQIKLARFSKMTTILTVGCEIPGEMGRYVDLRSKSSLLDADFVIIEPSLEYHRSGADFHKGKLVLSSHASFNFLELLDHWRKELEGFLDLGKTVFVIMGNLVEVYVSDEEPEDSLRSMGLPTTKNLRLVSNYDLLPYEMDIVESKGTSMILHPGERLLCEYFRQFGDESEYRIHMGEPDSFTPLLTTRQGGRVVGGIKRNNHGGALVALPWIEFDREEFYDEGNDGGDSNDEEWNWTPEGIAWGNRYLRTLEALDKSIRRKTATTLVPQWAQDDKFRTNQEIALCKELTQIESKISVLEGEREKVREAFSDAVVLKGLLFEQGRALENAIHDAMRLMGFDVDYFRDSDSEFDVVLECAEGRCIGEAEGRDRKPINIDKMRQLSDNIHEDLSRAEVSEPAHGILFGNAYRLSPPTDRPAEHFTAKCMKAAARNGTALVRTCDLFEVAKALADEPNEEFAASCRNAIINTAGEVVSFPSFPTRTKTTD